jgi:hydrogenase-1 operon protein HyaE
MTATLAAAPTSLDRLAQAIARMTTRHGFRLVPEEEAEHFSPAGHVVLLLTEDPQRNLEVLDACVILPEALKAMGDRLMPWVADHEASRALMRRFGVARAPAVVFLRDGEYLGVLNGIRDWAEYQAEVSSLLNGPALPKPIGIPVRAADRQGACA